jgi:hypothetical protein
MKRHGAHRDQAFERHQGRGELHLRKVNGEWKAWDVVIDGISYVKSYREDYGAEVQQKGLDAVIAGSKPSAGAKAAKVKTPDRLKTRRESARRARRISEAPVRSP